MNKETFKKGDRVQFVNSDGDIVEGYVDFVCISGRYVSIETNNGCDFHNVLTCDVFPIGSLDGYDPNDTAGAWNLTPLEWMFCTMHGLNFQAVYSWWHDLPSFVRDVMVRRYQNKLHFGPEEVMFECYLKREGEVGAEILDIIEAEWGLSRKESN